jgi:hypothetical protein
MFIGVLYQSTVNNSNNKQVGLNKTKRLLHSKRSNQQAENENATYRMV